MIDWILRKLVAAAEAAGSVGLVTYDPSTKTFTLSALGVEVQAYSAKLAALAGLSGTGFTAHTGTNTFAERTIGGDSRSLSVSNGSGVSGNPAVAWNSLFSLLNPAYYSVHYVMGTGTAEGSFRAVAGGLNVTNNFVDGLAALTLTSTNANGTAYYRTSLSQFDRASFRSTRIATFHVMFKTPSSGTSVRMWAGCFTALPGTSATPAGATAAVVFDTSTDSSNLVLRTYNGSGSYSDATITTFSTSTWYTAELSMSAATGEVSARVYNHTSGSWSASQTAFIPFTNGTPFGVGMYVVRLASGSITAYLNCAGGIVELL